MGLSDPTRSNPAETELPTHSLVVFLDKAASRQFQVPPQFKGSKDCVWLWGFGGRLPELEFQFSYCRPGKAWSNDSLSVLICDMVRRTASASSDSRDGWRVTVWSVCNSAWHLGGATRVLALCIFFTAGIRKSFVEKVIFEGDLQRRVRFQVAMMGKRRGESETGKENTPKSLEHKV